MARGVVLFLYLLEIDYLALLFFVANACNITILHTTIHFACIVCILTCARMENKHTYIRYLGNNLHTAAEVSDGCPSPIKPSRAAITGPAGEAALDYSPSVRQGEEELRFRKSLFLSTNTRTYPAAAHKQTNSWQKQIWSPISCWTGRP